MITNHLFVIANVKQLRTLVVLEFYCLFFRTSWGVGALNSAIFNSFHTRVEFGTILGTFGISGGGFESPQTPLRYATAPYAPYILPFAQRNELCSFVRSFVRLFVCSFVCL